MDSGCGWKILDWISLQRWQKFLWNKSNLRTNEITQLKLIKLEYNGLKLTYLTNPDLIVNYFSENVCRLSFSNNLYPSITELDYFYLLSIDNEPIGFIRAIDLFFDNSIEVHGSYAYKDNRYIKKYFMLSRLFANSMIVLFPNRHVMTMVNEKNNKVLPFVHWLGFKQIGKSDDGWLRFKLDRHIFFEDNKRLNLIIK